MPGLSITRLHTSSRDLIHRKHTNYVFIVLQSNKANPFSIQYRLSAGDPTTASERLPAHRMQNFAFAPIETPFGFLTIAVDYRPSTSVTIMEQTNSPAPRPQIITDYIGGGDRSPSRPRSTLLASLQERTQHSLVDPAPSPPVSSGACPSWFHFLRALLVSGPGVEPFLALFLLHRAEVPSLLTLRLLTPGWILQGRGSCAPRTSRSAGTFSAPSWRLRATRRRRHCR